MNIQKAILFGLVWLLKLNMLLVQASGQFDHLTVKDGLSISTVNAITQDYQGFLWFATQEGLNRYDGYSFKVFKHHRNDPNSLADHYFNSICPSRNGGVWVVHSKGLDYYSPKHDHFVHYHCATLPADALIPDSGHVFEDSLGNVWFGTLKGLNCLDSGSGQWRLYAETEKNSISHNHITEIFEDAYKNIWVGTHHGLNLWHRKKNQWQQFYFSQTDTNSLRHDLITDITSAAQNPDIIWIGTLKGICCFSYQDYQIKRFSFNDVHIDDSQFIDCLLIDKKNYLWVGTNQGLLQYSFSDHALHHFRHNPDEAKSLTNNQITCLFEDRGGIIWIGTKSFINKFDWQKTRWKSYQRHQNNTDSLSHDIVTAICQDHQDVFWIGTHGGGLNQFHPATGKWKSYQANAKKPNFVTDNKISCIIEDRQNYLWVGTSAHGITRLYPNRKDWQKIDRIGDASKRISDNRIQSIFQDQQGLIWITTYFGINCFNPDNQQWKYYIHDQKNANSLSSNDVTCIIQDKKKRYWIGTYDQGLNLFDKDKNTWKAFKPDPDNPEQSVAHAIVITLCEDSQGNIWAGTAGGINKISFAGEKPVFTFFAEETGAIGSIILGIIEDFQQNIWFTSNNGLSRYNPITRQFKNYFSEDGLLNNEYWERSFCLAKSGEIFIGGLFGMNSFFPQTITQNKHIPPVAITSFGKFNRPARFPASYFDKKSIRLSYQDAYFSFEFAALDFTNPSANQYAYQMEGFDEHWIYCDSSHRTANYTRLPGGNYVFKVKASNNDHIWNEQGISLSIIVIPPFWKTLWFQLLMIFVAAVIVFSWVKYREYRIEEQRLILKKKVEERTAEVLRQKTTIEEKNLEITNSINYAKRIQHAMLPKDQSFQMEFKEFFIIYLPKDIVSGDFYWLIQLPQSIYLAVVDCTGHGVPGAFMSIIGNSKLNQIINIYHIHRPSEILTALNGMVQQELHQTNRDDSTRDGMDVGLCQINPQESAIVFSGAKRPIYLLSSKPPTANSPDLLSHPTPKWYLNEIRGDSFSIGGFQKKPTIGFSEHTIPYLPNDCLYLFSDGFSDQMNEHDKKFSTKKLKQLLMEIAHLPMPDQKTILLDCYNQHKGVAPQIDDITIIGFRL